MTCKTTKPGHVPPQYYRYDGGYATVTHCTGCGRVGLYEDCHPVNPCSQCGGTLKSGHAARWEWVPTGRVVRRFFGLLRMDELEGRWMFASGGSKP